MTATPGFPNELIKVLGTLPFEGLQPTWSLKCNGGSFSVTITWQSKNPAAICKGRHLGKHPKLVKDRGTVDRGAVRVESQLSNPSPASKTGSGKPNQTRRKKKSPSARKRDRERLLAWKANRKRQTDVKSATDIGSELKPLEPKPVPSTSSAVVPPIVHASDSKVQSRDKVDEHLGLDYSTCSDDVVEDTENEDSDGDSFLLSDDYDPKRDGRCFTCHKPGASVPGGLKKCTRCQSIWYCGRDCQTKDWNNHRRICTAVSSIRKLDIVSQ